MNFTKHHVIQRGSALVALLAAGLCIGIGGSGPLAPAHASARRLAPTVRGQVMVILAKEAPGTIDPSLAELSALRRPPFDVFRSMEVLGRPTLNLRPGRDQEVELPNGRRLRVLLQQVMPDGRFRVRVSINRPNQSDYLPLLQVLASPGDPFFVAGQAHDGGTLLIGIRLGT